MLATWHWHIEVSSKCTLRCPRCARSEVPVGLVNTELDLEFFQRNFTPEFINQHVRKITFCGDDGDVIITNGSHKKVHWWKELGEVLDSNDTVHFSLDGWDNPSNSIYRKGSDFMGVLDGIVALRNNTQAQLVWAAIAFKFNEDHLDYMQELATALKMDRFQLTKSTKFAQVYPIYGPTDELQPKPELIAQNQRFERIITQLSDRLPASTPVENTIAWHKTATEYANKPVIPLCAVGNKGLYINAQGQLFPCCWVANRYTHNSSWQTLAQRFDLNTRLLTDVLADPFWDNEFRSFEWQECRTKCAADVVNEKYASEW
jgi:MoaA/NifB/PqqE/SkfB family radical SAM enzyme